MKSVDRELIRLTAQIYIERFRKWPDDMTDDVAQVEYSAKVARAIMAETYEKDQAAKINNLEKEREFFKMRNEQLQRLREIAENILDGIEGNKNIGCRMAYDDFSKDVPRSF